MLPEAEDYYWTMAARNRLILISADGQNVGLCTFFVLARLEDVPVYYHRPMWSTPPDREDGSLVYVDKLVSMVWTPSIRQALEEALIGRVPSLEQGIWYRPGYDADIRHTVRVKRRLVTHG